jgi:CBS domain-containing protein
LGLVEQKYFLKKIHPFDELDEFELEKLAQNLDVAYYKDNEVILHPSEKPQFLVFIIKGVIQEIDEDDQVSSIYTENDYFDPISLIENRVKKTFKVAQESICYLLERQVFLDMVYNNESIESYFFQSISQKLNSQISKDKDKELTSFMVARVKDAYLHKPVIVDETVTIYDTVKTMKENKSKFVLVKKGEDLGIVTDTNFREDVILNRLSFDTPIDQITTYNLITVDKNEFLFNAQLIMTKHAIKRVVVLDEDGNIDGILDQISLISFFASHTYAVTNEVEKATTIEELKNASNNFIRIIRALFAKGVKVRYISKLLNELNAKVFNKLFELTAPKELIGKSAFIIMGSEGRGEQILRTDQDNALILSDDCQIDERVLKEFTQKFNDTLCDFGYPKCSGNIMVCNPYWTRKQKDFKELIYDWINYPSEENFMNLAIFYDAITVVGEDELLVGLKEYLYNLFNDSSSILSNFSKSALMFETPLGFFTDFITDKEHKNELDIKKGGIFPIVQGIRSLALEHRVSQTNSVERIKELNNIGVLDLEMSKELIEAFNFLLTIRLKNRLQKIDNAQTPDNYINPDNLNKLDKDLLKDSFKIVDKFKKFLTYHFKLNLVS